MKLFNTRIIVCIYIREQTRNTTKVAGWPQGERSKTPLPASGVIPYKVRDLVGQTQLQYMLHVTSHKQANKQ